MKRVLFDTNIFLDVLLERDPHFWASSEAWTEIEAGSIVGMLSAHAVTTLHYLIGKQLGNAKAQTVIAELLRGFEVAAIDGSVIDKALKLNFADFEDAVTAVAAKSSGCDLIITRDPKGFRGSPVRCMTPAAAIPLLRVVRT